MSATSPRRSRWSGRRRPERGAAPRLSEVVEALHAASRRDGPRLVERWLDRLDASGRYALIKLVTGGLRVGVTARLAKQALARFGGKDVTEIEEIWHGLKPPYVEFFAWLEGRGERPVSAALAPFRPVMLAHALDEAEFPKLDPKDYAAEWKWDGIRVQAVSEKGVRKLYSRTGDDISGAFPDILEHPRFRRRASTASCWSAARRTGAIAVAPFGDLQQRLNRKTVSAKLIESHPAFIRAYDLLQDGADDLARRCPSRERRKRLEAFVARARLAADRPLAARRLPRLGRSWRSCAPNPPTDGRIHEVAEGLMLKRWDSAYVPGRPKGPWFKWKRDPHIIDAVLMYAQRGHGKRSSFYSDYTFGVWAGAGGRARAGAGRKGLFRLHRRGAARARPLRAQQHDRALRPGARGARRAGPRPRARSRLRGAEPLDPPPLRHRHALPAHQPAALGQAAGGGGPAGDAGEAAAAVSSSPCEAGLRRGA